MLRRWKRLFGKTEAVAKAEARPADPCRPTCLIDIGGHPELSNLFIHPSDEEIQSALDAWTWLDIRELTPIAVSAFGDVFFQGSQGVLCLDTIEGHLRHVAGSAENLIALLQSEEARDELLLAGLVIGMRSRGEHLEVGECYDFRLAPVVGGTMTADSIHKMSFRVKLHLTGQLHDQIRDLPDGTRVYFKMSD